MWCCWISPGHKIRLQPGAQSARSEYRAAPVLVRGEARVAIRCVKLAWLFSADEAHAEGEGAALATGEGAEIGSVEIVDYRVGILAV